MTTAPPEYDDDKETVKLTEAEENSDDSAPADSVETECLAAVESALNIQYGALSFEPGEAIFKEGEQSGIMFIIQEGQVRLSRKVGGQERTLRTIGPGEIFGEIRSMKECARPVTAVAEGPVKLVAFEQKSFETMLSENPGISLRVVQALAPRIKTSEVSLENIEFRSPIARIVNTLIRCAMDEGLESDQGYALSTEPEELSALAGVSQATLRDALGSLVHDKLVKLKKSQIILPDLGKLYQKLAQDSPEVSTSMLRTIAIRVQTSKVKDCEAGQDPESVVVSGIIHDVTESGLKSKRGIVIRTGLEELAEKIGLEMPALKENLDILAEKKLIEYSDQEIVVFDVKKLYRYMKYLRLKEEFAGS